MSKRQFPDVQSLLAARFGDAASPFDLGDAEQLLHSMAARGSCRAFLDDHVPLPLLETLCALALASPTKSDLQQRDIVLLTSDDRRRQLATLVAGQAWVADAPMIAIFCGNNQRQRMLHDLHDVPFANDHLDALFNAAVDASVALSAFVTAAEAVGLGCCPISAVRNDATAVSELLGLPDHVFPVAGLAIGYRAAVPEISRRLPLAQTVHIDHYDDSGVRKAVEEYDTSRATTQPYTKQRFTKAFGTSPTYCWSEDKVRQYSQPERETFGAFIRAKGFRLD
jgi:nitroreductase/FMN reductase [NAD(P)H]